MTFFFPLIGDRLLRIAFFFVLLALSQAASAQELFGDVEEKASVESPAWLVPEPAEFAGDAHEKLYRGFSKVLGGLEMKAKVKLEKLGKGYLGAIDRLAEAGDRSALLEARQFRSEVGDGAGGTDIEPSAEVAKLIGVMNVQVGKIRGVQIEAALKAFLTYDEHIDKLSDSLTSASDFDGVKLIGNELDDVIRPKIRQMKVTMPTSKLGKMGLAEQQKIPGSAREFEKHRYKVYGVAVGFEEAQKRCEALGGHLVTIGSEEESDFVSGIVNLEQKKGLWIGLSRTSGEGDWRWVDGEKLDEEFVMFKEKRRRTSSRDKETAEYSDKVDYMMLYMSGTTERLHWLVHYSETGTLTDDGYICEWEP